MTYNPLWISYHSTIPTTMVDHVTGTLTMKEYCSWLSGLHPLYGWSSLVGMGVCMCEFFYVLTIIFLCTCSCTCRSASDYLYLLKCSWLHVLVAVLLITCNCWSASDYMYLLKCFWLHVHVKVLLITCTCWSAPDYMLKCFWLRTCCCDTAQSLWSARLLLIFIYLKV